MENETVDEKVRRLASRVEELEKLLAQLEYPCLEDGGYECFMCGDVEKIGTPHNPKCVVAILLAGAHAEEKPPDG
jgi:hypothetical protein